ncbi:MAG TPA: hypothetical protein VK395_27960 [Gemmataceae bacterium]|nr:hypothetical protein [Gemmataceae bacterium]
MDGEPEREIPEGAAVFPQIPPELGVNPILLAVIHATVFLTGSDSSIVHPQAADEVVEYMAAYLGRLKGQPLEQVREDMTCLIGYARHEKWPKQVIRSLQTFLEDYGIGEEGDS